MSTALKACAGPMARPATNGSSRLPSALGKIRAQPQQRRIQPALITSSGEMKGHGVSVCEATKQPALLYLYTGKKEYLDAVVGAFKALERDHELVDGVISSDEGLHGKKPEGLHETCDISDYTWSLGYVLQASGDGVWGDKIERAVLNAGLGAVDKDFKAHQYFSSPNRVVSNQTCSAAKFGPVHADRQSYRAGFATQCCTGTLRLLPNYAARMWMSDNKGGIAATLLWTKHASRHGRRERRPRYHCRKNRLSLRWRGGAGRHAAYSRSPFRSTFAFPAGPTGKRHRQRSSPSPIRPRPAPSSRSTGLRFR